MINGILSMQLLDKKGKSVIADNRCDDISLGEMEFTVQISLEERKILDKFMDMLGNQIEFTNYIRKLFDLGGSIYFFKKEECKYIGVAQNMKEYFSFDTLNLDQMSCDKDGQIVDLYTMNPILIDGKIQYFKL